MYTFNDFIQGVQQRLATSNEINWHDAVALVPQTQQSQVFGWVNDGRLRGLWTVSVVPDTVRGVGNMPMISKVAAAAPTTEGGG